MSLQTIVVRNPATLEKIAELPAAQAVDVAAAVKRGREAQTLWQKTGFDERAKKLGEVVIVFHQLGNDDADVVDREFADERSEKDD